MVSVSSGRAQVFGAVVAQLPGQSSGGTSVADGTQIKGDFELLQFIAAPDRTAAQPLAQARDA